MKKCFSCNLNFEEILYTTSNSVDSISVCPNCSATELNRIDIKPNVFIKCELCNCDGFNFDCYDMRVNLCMHHIKKMLMLNLSPYEFEKLYRKHPRAFLLHDDFYDPNTGEAFQSME